jgi:hypothetical protein
MEKLTDWKSLWKNLKVGDVFNRIYVGDNKAYAKINGKGTLRVIETRPEFQAVELFAQFGSPTTEELQSRTITFSNPDLAFKDSELFVPSNESEWFKKSVKVHSLKKALRLGVTLSDIRKYASWSGYCPFVAHMNGAPDYGLRCVSCQFDVEGRDKTQPLLQTVFVVWRTWNSLIADFKRLKIKVRT